MRPSKEVYVLRQWIRILLGCVVVISAASVFGDSVVRCESKGSRRICRVDNIGSVVLKHQRSISSCTEGESWGYTRDAIWVDNGCRADFQVSNRRNDRDRDADRDRDRNRDRDQNRDRDRGGPLICESQGGRQFCPADTRFGVKLARSLGRRDCVEGSSWGFNDRGVWVDRGCRGEFTLGTEPREERRSPQVLRCESDNNRRRRCSADTRFGVEMKRQISLTECVFNRTWGYDRDGVWVSDGCRAEFLIRAR
jgi:hypothetical protein